MQRVRGITVDNIWTNPSEKKGEDHCTANEIGMKDLVESQFIDRIADIFVQLLEISWKDRSSFKSTVRIAIGPKVDDLLNQFLNYHLEGIVKSINAHLGINGKVNYEYATHARLRDLTNTIEEIIGKDKVKELRETARKPDKELPSNEEQNQKKSE